MLNRFGSTSSVSCQFLVLESSLFQVIFMKNQAKNPIFEGLCYNLKGLEFFSKTNFESSWVSEGLKIYRICILCYPFGFWHQLFCPSPFKIFWKIYQKSELYLERKVFSGQLAAAAGYFLWIIKTQCAHQFLRLNSKSATPPFNSRAVVNLSSIGDAKSR